MVMNPIIGGIFLLGASTVLMWRFERKYRHLTRAPIERLDGLPGGSVGSNGGILSEGIVVPAAMIVGYSSDYNNPIFYGLFPSRGDLETMMRAEGGNVDLFIVSQATASKYFQHHGGPATRFSPGLHFPHPKDPDVLVPAQEYSKRLFEELRQEWVRTFEALGAKRIVIADTTEQTWHSKLRAKPQGVDVAADLRIVYGEECVDESTYVDGTFDQERALRDRRWLGDHPEILSIVEGRVHGTQATWRRSVRVDTSFGVDVAVLNVVKASVKREVRRELVFYVEFFPK